MADFVLENGVVHGAHGTTAALWRQAVMVVLAGEGGGQMQLGIALSPSARDAFAHQNATAHEHLQVGVAAWQHVLIVDSYRSLNPDQS